MSFTVLGWTISWPLVCTLFALLLAREIWNLTYFWRQGIPGPLPYPYIGNTLQLFRGMHNSLPPMYKKYGKTMGIYAMGSPMLCITDPDMIKDITVKNFSKFMNHLQMAITDKAFEKGLVTLTDQRWKSIRNVITPTFSGNKMKMMSPLINECCDTLVDSLCEKQRKGDAEMNVVDLFGGFTMDAIAKCAFGLDVNSQRDPNDPFTAHAKNVMAPPSISLKMIIGGMFPAVGRLMKAMGVRFVEPEDADFFISVAEKALSMRKAQSDSERKDFLQLMANAHEEDEDEVDKSDEANDLHSLIDEHHDTSFFDQRKTKKTKLTLEEIIAQAFLFFVAGYETTNTTLSFAAYCLATNPEIQDELIEEIEERAPSRESLDYTSIAKMPYLDGVICETLRLYPPAVGTDRVCNEDHAYNGTSIPRGMQILIDMFSMHRDPDFWPNPDTFDPTRFTKENRAERHPFAWMPFGAGPRNCIGMRFALLEIKMAMVRLLQRFRFETSASTQIPLKFGVVSLKPTDGIFLRAVDRRSTQIDTEEKQ